ncbi:neural cell adhesion molecule 1-A-like isoform X2 [Leptopilina boulardi]|uniref:neural cell adhesion molecule 1-A-like isoform X2 n=1 Tax=Leptopilina boulardi TaxID=63433 RepID=UPI0021F52164|nr:neural cell adhesion molecule 1-A-like isoform X2 [Leptopilina boulardi]
MNRSGVLTIFLVLLFTRGFSYPNVKTADYADDTPDDDDDDDSETNNPKEENSKPIRLISKDSTIEVFPDEQIILPCETVNGDDPVVTWNRKIKGDNDVLFFGDASLIQDESDKMRISRTHNNSLVIKNARIEDSGTYVCQLNVAAIENNPNNVTYTVRVSNNQQTLKISPGKSVTVNEREDIMLSCNIVSKEDPVSLIWTHGSHKLHPTLRQNKMAQVHIKHATRHHAGFYQCLADFGPGRDPLHNVIDVSVRYAPEVEVLHEYVHSGIGETANLTCVVHAFPVANISWYKKEGDASKLISNSNHIDIKDGKHIHNLTLKDIQKHDFGKYLCRSSNVLGTHQKEVELTGSPSRARFFERYLKDDDKTIVLKWEVESFSPITGYELRYRKNENSDWIVEKPNRVISGNEVNKYIAEHAIHNLEPDTYHFELRSQNKFGWSEYSIAESIEGRYNLQKAGIGPNGASSSQPIMFLLASLLVVSVLCKNL